MYNPEWRNHPNLSWKSSQGQGYCRLSFQGPSSNNQFYKENQFNATPSVATYVPPNQTKPSLEDTLQQFMQSQLITNQNQAQMCHNQDQTIARLEVQIEQLAATVREREKGNFPSQTVPKPRG